MKRVFLTFGIAAAVVLAGRAAIAGKYPELNDRHHFAAKAHAAGPGGAGRRPSCHTRDGAGTSAGATTLASCPYHGHCSYGGRDIRYSSTPYPSCGGCISGSTWSAGQNIDHFSCHETREAIPDEDLNA